MVTEISRNKFGPIDLFPLSLSPERSASIVAARTAFLFGPFLDPMIHVAVQRVNDGRINKENAGLALSTVAELFNSAGKDYYRQEPKLAGDELARHIENVLKGEIVLVPEAVEMNPVNRIAELTRADQAFSNMPPEIQAHIAELNYEAFFSDQTMAGGKATRVRNQLDDLLSSLGREQQAMPHVTLTNWAIGYIVAGLYAHMSQSDTGTIRVIDTGSGPGGTIAAICDRLQVVNGNGNIALTCVETTQGFYDQLHEFTENDEVIRGLHLSVRTLGSSISEGISQIGALTTVKSDALSALKSFDVNEVGQNDLVVISGNYSWHRLDSRTKQEIMNHFRNVPNVLFLIGDFAHHGSPVAKRYFCLGANGPLNTGNIGLAEQFSKSGYSLWNIANNKLSFLDERIAAQLVQDDRDPDVDGHLWIAYRGELTEKSLGR